MALTEQVRVSVTIQDEFGIQASTTAYLLIDPTATVSDIKAAWTAYQQAIDGITDGQIIHGAISFDLAPDSVKTAPVDGSRVEIAGNFNFLDNGPGNRKWAATIPAFGSFGLNGDRIDLTYAGVETFVSLLTTVVTGVSEYANAHYQPLTTLADAFLSTRKHRKQLQRSSFELS